jgi:hypothetical protein
MKKIVALLVAMAMTAIFLPAVANAEFKVGVSVGSEGVNNFYAALGDYNNVEQKDVLEVRHQGISDEELPVVFFMASKANVPSREIVRLRAKHWGWAKIAAKYRIDAAAFYVPVNGEVTGHIYGGMYKNYGAPQNKWKKIKLSDADIVNSVNLRFVSEKYGYAPEEVIRMRENGRDFVSIHEDIRAAHEKNAHHKFWEKKDPNFRDNGDNKDNRDKHSRDHNDDRGNR